MVVSQGGVPGPSGGQSITVRASANPAKGTLPLTVSFASSVTGGQQPYVFRWSFADGSFSSESNPTHTYRLAGTYTVALDVYDSSGHWGSIDLPVFVLSQFEATISSNATKGSVPLTVSFSSNATGGNPPYSYRWDFGDGGTSSSKEILHTYPQAGSYTAKITVKDSAGSESTKSLQVTAIAGEAKGQEITAIAGEAKGQETFSSNAILLISIAVIVGGVIILKRTRRRLQDARNSHVNSLESLKIRY